MRQIQGAIEMPIPVVRQDVPKAAPVAEESEEIKEDIG